MSAPATLKDQLAAEIVKSEAEAAANPDKFTGSDWWQLSEAEESVFEIDPDRWPRMMITYHCYEGFKLIVHSPVWDEALIHQARQERPKWCDTPPSDHELARFAEEYGELTNREAYALYAKQEFWTVRLGVMVYADERRQADIDNKMAQARRQRERDEWTKNHPGIDLGKA
jgi:hypothetical protein